MVWTVDPLPGGGPLRCEQALFLVVAQRSHAYTGPGSEFADAHIPILRL